MDKNRGDLQNNEKIATITKVGYGLRDFPWQTGAMWITVSYDGYVILLTFSPQETEALLQKYTIYDIFNLKGKDCIIVENNGIVVFERLEERGNL